jgi:hypothetical protein
VTDPETPTPGTDPVTSGSKPIATEPAMGDKGLTAEEAAAVANVTLEPTVRRMSILNWSLIQMTGNGDWALWAPLAVMERMLSDLDYGRARDPQTAERILGLVVVTLRRQAARLEAHVHAIERTRGTGGTLPALPHWEADETLAMYDLVEMAYPIVDEKDTVDLQALADLMELVGDAHGLPDTNEGRLAVVGAWDETARRVALRWGMNRSLSVMGTLAAGVPLIDRPAFIPPPTRDRLAERLRTTP